MAEHGIPAVERAVEVLEALSDRPGSTITDLAAALPIPRSSIYRILNSLQGLDMVARDLGGAYELGPRLIRLARGVRAGADLTSLARPDMQSLSNELACTVKLSVFDRDAALVVAVAESPQTYSVTTQIGRRFPLHAGAASKVLLAFAPDELRERVLKEPLQRYTPSTITDRAALASVLETIRAEACAEDQGEFVAGVHAIAAPILDGAGAGIAALSIPFLAGMEPSRVDVVRTELRKTADRISRKIGGGPAAKI